MTQSFTTIYKLRNTIPLRSAHTRRPAYTFRQNSLRHLTFETPFPRFYRAQKTGGMNGACAPFGGRRARCARARGGARCARAAWGDGPVGPFGVIPKPFRMESISNGELLRKEAHSEMKTVAVRNPPESKWSEIKAKLIILSIWATFGPKCFKDFPF